MIPDIIQMVAIKDIELVPLLRRSINEEKLAGLVQSLREVDLLYPPRLSPHGEKFLPTDGYHRILAAMKLGWTEIPAIIESKPLSEGEMIQRGFIANSQRVENSHLEKAEGIARLIVVTGWNASTVAEKLGLSNATVSRLLSLLELPEPIRERVHRGDISLSAACELARVEDGDVQASLAGQVAAGKLTRDALAGSVKSRKRAASVPATTAPSRVTAKLGGGRAVSVVGETLDLEGFIEMLEEVLTKARKARTQGIEVGTFAKMLRDQAG